MTTKKYSEEIKRFPARTQEGKPCEILERVTFGRDVLEDGSLGPPGEVNRRYDLRTGERLNRLTDTEFEDDETGARLLLQR
jgi:hypothetical protein